MKWLTIGRQLLSLSAAIIVGFIPSESVQAQQSEQLRTFAVAEPGALSAAPWLRTHLPQQAMAYVRIPSLWGLIGEGKGNYISQFLASEPGSEALQQLRQALETKLLSLIDTQSEQLFFTAFAQLQSPVEAALLHPQFINSEEPAILLSAKMAQQSLAVNRQILTALVQEIAGQWQAPLDDTGSGSFSLPDMFVQVYYDVASQRLYLLSSPNPLTTENDLKTLITRFTVNEQHPMLALEAEIDQSGQGLYAWIDTVAATQLAAVLLPQEAQGIMAMSGVTQATQLAFGLGVSQGKGRLNITLLMPKVGFRNFFPAVAADFAVNVVEDPSAAVLLGLPEVADWGAFLNGVAAVDPGLWSDLQSFEQELQQVTGKTVAEWLAVFGPELAYVFDPAGGYAMVRLRDEKRFAEFIKTLQSRYQLAYETREVNGQQYAHLALLNLELNTADDVEQLFAYSLSGLPSHLYWKQEDDYLLLAAVPQILFDRDYSAAKTILSHWLQNKQGLAVNDAVLAVSMSVNDAPATMYSYYLQYLQTLADAAGYSIDLFALPSALELAMPKQGSYSLKLASGADRIGLEMVFESNPFEVLYSSAGMTAFLVLGIGTAIAIPALINYY